MFGEIVYPRVSAGSYCWPINIEKRFIPFSELLFGLQRGVEFELFAALVETVSVFVGCNGYPLHQRVADVTQIADDVQFLLAREVVADIVVIDTRCLVGCLRLLD